MIDFPDFLLRAWFAGIGLASIAGPLGCLVVWRRMAYLGDTLAHAGLLGIVLGVLLDIEPMLGVGFVCVLVVLVLTALQQQRRLASDTLLGILAHASLAVGLVTLGIFDSVRIDLLGYLMGDVLAVDQADLISIYIGCAIVLLVLIILWERLILWTLNEELARAEGGSDMYGSAALRLVPMLLLAITVAVAMKIVGILLITAMLIIPPATARMLVSTPERMAVVAGLLGMLAVTAGLFVSFELDTPTGPSIVVSALVLFALALIKKTLPL